MCDPGYSKGKTNNLGHLEENKHAVIAGKEFWKDTVQELEFASDTIEELVIETWPLHRLLYRLIDERICAMVELAFIQKLSVKGQTIANLS